MNVPVQILFEIAQTGKEGAIGIAGVRWSIEVMRQFAQTPQRGARVIVFMDHTANRAVERNRRSFALAHRRHQRKKDLFLFDYVAAEFIVEPLESLEHLNKQWRVSAMHLRD